MFQVLLKRLKITIVLMYILQMGVCLFIAYSAFERIAEQDTYKSYSDFLNVTEKL